MREKAVYYYNHGYNCSQCLLKAAEQRFKIPIVKQCYNSCKAVNTGFGIGEMCSVLIAAIMIFGVMFDEPTARRLRIKLLDTFKSEYGALSCGALLKERGSDDNCRKIVGDIAELTEKIILEELG